MTAPHADLATPGGIYSLIRDGRAASRADIARVTGLAPSTVTLRVDQLVRLGYLVESGEGKSRGGRRPRVLKVARDGRCVAAVDLGARHANIAIFDLAGEKVAGRQVGIDITLPPETVLRRIHEEIRSILEGREGDELRGIGIALPGPVSAPEGRVISPSRMPGWNGVDPAAILSGISGVRVRSENDANAMAFGEYIAGGRIARHMIVVKAGSSIGTGVIVDGRLYRGARGLAGDISHIAVSGASQVLCSCGRLGCLDAVAGGRSIVLALNAAGVPVTDIADVTQLAGDAHPLTTRLLREAGLRVGAALATLVAFFDPERLVLAGSLCGCALLAMLVPTHAPGDPATAITLRPTNLFLLWPLAYLVLNVAYSFVLKRLVIVDCMCIALGFQLRIQAGAAAISVEASNWLQLCTFFFALFLAFCKRYEELGRQTEASGQTRKTMSDYTTSFLNMMIGPLAALSILSYALYTVSSETVKRHGTDKLMYTVPFVTYGVFRYLFLVYHKSEGGDPARLLFRDAPLILSGLLYAGVVLMVLRGGAA